MNYCYEELVEDLSRGHEIEFSYHGEKYSISRNKDGWYLTKYNDENAQQTFKESDELLKKAKIGSKNIYLIWNEVEDISVF